MAPDWEYKGLILKICGDLKEGSHRERGKEVHLRFGLES